ncbi:MAG: glycosyltransferase family 4 protein [Planctomycetota bacterium]
MRILFVTAGFLPDCIGGVELHLLGLARFLSGAHEVMVFARGADPARGEFESYRYEVEGIPVVRLNYLFSDCTGFRMIYRNGTIRRRFEDLLREFRPDLVHVHHLTCLSTDLIDAAREAGAKVVMTLHDFWMGCPRGQRMTPELFLCHEIDLRRCAECLPKMWGGWFGTGRDQEQLEEYHQWIHGVLCRADRLVTPSASSRELFVDYGIPGERIRVVENGLEQDALRGLSRSNRGPFRFGFLGSVLPTKGVHVLVEAFRILGRKEARLDVHGEILPWHEISDYGARLKEAARGLETQVAFHGRYGPAELPAILSSFDALVVPSLWFEAFCLTLREGFLAGLPVLVSNLGAMAEGVEDGTTGLLFRAGDAADLAHKMERILDDEELRIRLSTSVKKVRTMAENGRELLSLYEELVRG